MQLTSENIYHYLSLKGLINCETAVDGNFMVQEIPTRTRIKKVFMQPARSLFVKQPTANSLSADILKREFEAWRFLSVPGRFPKLAGRIPELIHYNKDFHILITELLPNSQNLQEFYIKTKSFPADIAVQQAEVLSAFHHPLTADMDMSAFPKTLPWVLQIPQHHAAAFFPGNTENEKLIAVIQGNPFLSNRIRQLALEWTQSHFMHGDVKWVNLLAVNEHNKIKLNLIDWELSDVGDPLWDVAGLLQSYVSTWVFGFDNKQATVHHFSPQFNSFHISAMRESAVIFLNEYLKLQNTAEIETHDRLSRIMEYTALRIIQTSVEGVEYEQQIQANNMRCIQLAHNILENPMRALHTLFQFNLQEHE